MAEICRPYLPRMSSSKRQRTDEPEAGRAISRSTSMWLDDGNIILQAENTQFRIHRTVLAMHSTVFQDMFGIPQPQGGPTVDGCAVVHLSDSAQDVEHFLNALYKRSYYMKNVPLDVFEAFLRLGHKYNVNHLRDEVVACLAAEFPTTLDGWDAQPDRFTTLDISDETGGTLRLLRLAQEFRLLRSLPTIFLTITATYTLEGLYEEAPLGISTDNILHIALAAEKFRETRNKITFSWLKQLPCGSCTSTKTCSTARKRLVCLFFFEPEVAAFGTGGANPLSEWEDDWLKNLCTQCGLVAKAGHVAGRSQVWEDLPKHFKLPGWGDLTNFE